MERLKIVITGDTDEVREMAVAVVVDSIGSHVESVMGPSGIGRIEMADAYRVLRGVSSAEVSEGSSEVKKARKFIDNLISFQLSATEELFGRIFGEATGEHLWRKFKAKSQDFNVLKMWQDLDLENRRKFLEYFLNTFSN